MAIFTPTAGRNRDNRLEVFVTKGQIKIILEHSSQEGAASGNWSNWESLGGEVFAINIINDDNGWLNLFHLVARSS